jgi:hypothetical protein
MDTRMRAPDRLSRMESIPALEPLGNHQREGINILHAKDLPNVTVQPFKAWRPPRMKTGLRNHPIGRKIAIAPLPEK